MNQFYSIGLMSGSSLDGLDICYSLLSFDQHQYHYQIIHANTLSYSEQMSNRLSDARSLSAYDLAVLDVDLAHEVAALVAQFIDQHHIQTIDAIAHHGHTVYHFPSDGFSMQIGHNHWLAHLLQKPIFGHLRTQNIILGGQGAPIVPLTDHLLFSQYTHCINLGGIANITIQTHATQASFDISICNQLLNSLASRLSLPYDDRGRIAQSGHMIQPLFEQFNQLPYFSLAHPKSLDNSILSTYLQLIADSDCPIPDLMHTATHHIAYQIAQTLTTDARVLVTGGGALNDYLISLIEHYACLSIPVPDIYLIQYKEALAMSLMAFRSRQKLPNILARFTGGQRDCVSGQWFDPF